MQIGLREANRHFSRLMKAVRGGREVLLTERGKPLAVVRPIRTGDDVETVIQRLETAGNGWNPAITRQARDSPTMEASHNARRTALEDHSGRER